MRAYINTVLEIQEEWNGMDAVSITLCYLVFAIVMFVWEKIPLSITAMLVSVGLVLSGVLSPKEAFAGFVDGNVLLFMAILIMS